MACKAITGYDTDVTYYYPQVSRASRHNRTDGLLHARGRPMVNVGIVIGRFLRTTRQLTLPPAIGNMDQPGQCTADAADMDWLMTSQTGLSMKSTLLCNVGAKNRELRASRGPRKPVVKNMTMKTPRARLSERESVMTANGKKSAREGMYEAK